jgi:cysteine-rich repeat protein
MNDSCSTICGDGIIAGMEECDDANTISGDGCSYTCANENCSAICTCDGWGFPFVNGICTPICGDTLIRGVEECDDGNVANYDGCSSGCKVEGCNVTCNCSGWSLPRVDGSCSTVCGDGISLGT